VTEHPANAKAQIVATMPFMILPCQPVPIVLPARLDGQRSFTRHLNSPAVMGAPEGLRGKGAIPPRVMVFQIFAPNWPRALRGAILSTHRSRYAPSFMWGIPWVGGGNSCLFVALAGQEKCRYCWLSEPYNSLPRLGSGVRFASPAPGFSFSVRLVVRSLWARPPLDPGAHPDQKLAPWRRFCS
jgi:hypothetical protein